MKSGVLIGEWSFNQKEEFKSESGILIRKWNWNQEVELESGSGILIREWSFNQEGILTIKLVSYCLSCFFFLVIQVIPSSRYRNKNYRNLMFKYFQLGIIIL